MDSDKDDGPHTDMEAAEASGDQDAEGPVYDLGWGALPSVKEVAANDGPTYDLGWGVIPSVKEVAARDGHDDEDGRTYDLGWGASPLVEEVVVGDGHDDADGPTYDLGWGVPPSVEDVTAGDGHGDDDGPTYDLGWGQLVDTPTVGDVALAAETDYVIDLTSDDITSQASVVDRDEDIIDLTEDDGPPYDLGWDPQPLSPLSPVTSQPSNKEVVAPKMIRSTVDDDHAQAIVEDAVHRSTDDRVPAAIVLENR
ncbi:hypothetical protein P692DRAFT_20879205 [Suillus brevipes Sb2]|nr:hypothetical protein P692DRAFT_20879205 [Suillus brevipes Sb2]